MKKRYALLTLGVGLLSATTAHAQNDRDTKVLKDRRQFEAAEEWVYNDLRQGIAEARAGNKPLLVVFRCVL